MTISAADIKAALQVSGGSDAQKNAAQAANLVALGFDSASATAMAAALTSGSGTSAINNQLSKYTPTEVSQPVVTAPTPVTAPSLATTLYSPTDYGPVLPTNSTPAPSPSPVSSATVNQGLSVATPTSSGTTYSAPAPVVQPQTPYTAAQVLAAISGGNTNTDNKQTAALTALGIDPTLAKSIAGSLSSTASMDTIAKIFSQNGVPLNTNLSYSNSTGNTLNGLYAADASYAYNMAKEGATIYDYLQKSSTGQGYFLPASIYKPNNQGNNDWVYTKQSINQDELAKAGGSVVSNNGETGYYFPDISSVNKTLTNSGYDSNGTLKYTRTGDQPSGGILGGALGDVFNSVQDVLHPITDVTKYFDPTGFSQYNEAAYNLNQGLKTGDLGTLLAAAGNAYAGANGLTVQDAVKNVMGSGTTTPTVGDVLPQTSTSTTPSVIDQLYGQGNTLDSVLNQNATNLGNTLSYGSVYGQNGSTVLNDFVNSPLSDALGNVGNAVSSLPSIPTVDSPLSIPITGGNVTTPTSIWDTVAKVATGIGVGAAALPTTPTTNNVTPTNTTNTTNTSGTNTTTDTSTTAIPDWAKALGASLGLSGSSLSSLFNTILGTTTQQGAIEANQTLADKILNYGNPYYEYQKNTLIPLKTQEGQLAQTLQGNAAQDRLSALDAANNASMQSQYDAQLGKVNTLQDLLTNQAQQTNPMVGTFNNAATTQLGQNDFYNNLLKTSYTDPLSVYNSPEMKSLSDVFMNTINRRDAAAGRNSQYGARAVEAQNNFLNNLNTYRGTLNTNIGTGANAATGYGNTAVGYQNADTQKLNAGTNLLGQANQTLSGISGQQQANTGIANSLNSIYGNTNAAANNALDFANVNTTPQTDQYGNLMSSANVAQATNNQSTITGGINAINSLYDLYKTATA